MGTYSKAPTASLVNRERRFQEEVARDARMGRQDAADESSARLRQVREELKRRGR